MASRHPIVGRAVTSPRHYRGTIARAFDAVTRKLGKEPPDVAVILGSGLGGFAETVGKPEALPYAQIAGFPKPTVEGHTGTLWCGEVGKRRVALFQGRFHYYEGHSLPLLVLPVRVAGRWGIRHLVVTNAAGSLRDDLRPGSLALIRDHINWIGQNPLRGPNLEEAGPRFIDMTEAYDRKHRETAGAVARKLGIGLGEGVYAALGGPSYETPAEVRMLKILGADLVGMSTVPEVIAARHQGMRVLGVSCITNWAAGVKPGVPAPVDHAEVIAMTREAGPQLARWLTEWIGTYDEN